MTVTQADLDALRANREHNRLERRSGYPIGLLVCVCPRPLASSYIDAGMCLICKRKPVALMRRPEVPV